VAFVRCNAGFSIADLTFNFSITYRSPTLTGNHYSKYQLFLYKTISEHREQGLTFDAISEWLNKERHLTERGKKFTGAHVHSILKKRLAKEELLNRGYPPVWSDFSMEVVDKAGVVQINEKMTYSSELQTILKLLTGNLCTHFNDETKSFFSYKCNSLEQD